MTAPQGQKTRRVSGAIARARRPNKNEIESLRLHVPYWFMVAVLLGFASVQIWLNPFGFSDLVQRYAQDVSDLLITGPYFYGTEGRENVSVAIVDENTLHTLHAPWPWKYGDHARVLDALLQYKPKAVVVDFLFVDSRPDDTLKDLADEFISKAASTCPMAKIRCAPNSHGPACRSSIRPFRSMRAWRGSTTPPAAASIRSLMATAPAPHWRCACSAMRTAANIRSRPSTT
jgi:hypothetical protein